MGGVDWGGIDRDKFDAKTAKLGGVTFAFRKLYQAPYGVDAGFAADWAAMLEADIVRFAYVFPDYRANAEPARKQVERMWAAFVAAGGWSIGDGALMVDVEFPGGKLPRPIPELVVFLQDFILAVKELFGCWAIIYASDRNWAGTDTDALRNPKTWITDRCPLLVKTGYVRAARQAPAPAPTGRPRTPAAWMAPSSPGAWANQYQGDAIGQPGFSSTVDEDRFLTLTRENATPEDAGRIAWVQRTLAILGEPYRGPIAASGTWDDDLDRALSAFQTHEGLDPDKVIGARTFARLSRQAGATS